MPVSQLAQRHFFLAQTLNGSSLRQESGVLFDPKGDDGELKVDPNGNDFQDEDQPEDGNKEDGSDQSEKAFRNQRQGKEASTYRRDRGKEHVDKEKEFNPMGGHKAGECSVEQRCEEAFLHGNHSQSGGGRWILMTNRKRAAGDKY